LIRKTLTLLVLLFWQSAHASITTDLQELVTDGQSINSDLSADTLASLGNLSLMLRSLATAVDGYVAAIGGLEAMTSDPTLYVSLKSMLQLSADIGVMANRILEEADVILAMADNIGLQADQIVYTQQTMNLSIAGVQASILAAQQMAITLIAEREL
jgi:hypothetical protein